MTRRSLPFLLLAVVLALVAANAATAEPSTASVRVSSLESAITLEVNAVRAARGLRPLRISPALTRAAASHSQAMLDGGFFAHDSVGGTTFADRLRQFYPPRGRWTVGENLAMYGGSEPTAQDVVGAWLASPQHRANLLRASFRELGLGVMFTPSGTGALAGGSAWVVTLDLGARGSR